MSTTARFGLVFGRLAITPEACSTWFLPRIVGMPTALDPIYRSDILTVESAREIGQAQGVHEPDTLITEARTFAHAKARGVLVRPLSDAVAISPPLISTREEIDNAATVIGESIAAVAADIGAAAGA